jgi:SAM-dependent methyltransferase
VDCDAYFHDYELERTASKPTACWDLLLSCTDDLAGMQRVLDIGCGNGAFLDLARQAGLSTAGADVSTSAAAAAALAGHNVVCASATEMSFADVTAFDVITMWDLLEHVPDPRRALERAYMLLTPGGRLVILTPAMGSVFDRAGLIIHRLSRRRFEKLLWMCWSDQHLFRFHPRGLCNVMRDMGYVEVSAKRVRLLSLGASCYAGSAIMPRWTRSTVLNRSISRLAVGLVRCCRITNKILVMGKRNAHAA